MSVIFFLRRNIHTVRKTQTPERGRERERERGQLAVYYTGPQSSIILFSYSLTLGTLENFGWLFFWVFKRFNDYHWGYTSIYWPLSYLFRPLPTHNHATTVICSLFENKMNKILVSHSCSSCTQHCILN